ncbi:MAG: hypothetical protein Q9173_000490 [Seirophora scorigena]
MTRDVGPAVAVGSTVVAVLNCPADAGESRAIIFLLAYRSNTGVRVKVKAASNQVVAALAARLDPAPAKNKHQGAMRDAKRVLATAGPPDAKDSCVQTVLANETFQLQDYQVVNAESTGLGVPVHFYVDLVVLDDVTHATERLSSS